MIVNERKRKITRKRAIRDYRPSPGLLLSGVFFMRFRVNPIWLPNHVTYDIICVNLLFLMDRRSYWIYPQTLKSSPEQLDRSRGNFTQMFPKACVYKVVKE